MGWLAGGRPLISNAQQRICESPLHNMSLPGNYKRLNCAAPGQGFQAVRSLQRSCTATARLSLNQYQYAWLPPRSASRSSPALLFSQLLIKCKAQRPARHVLLKQHLLCMQPGPMSMAQAVPGIMEQYHSIVPLEAETALSRPSAIFGVPSLACKAVSRADGQAVCLRYFSPMQVTNSACSCSGAAMLDTGCWQGGCECMQPPKAQQPRLWQSS